MNVLSVLVLLFCYMLIGESDEIETYPDDVKEYADFLKERYKENSIIETDWPLKVGNDDVFGRLALIQQKDNSTRQKDTSSFQEKSSDWYLLRGQVDEICDLAGNRKVDIKDILKPTTAKSDSTSLIVLIDGPPGIGKTTLCRKLLHMWSDGELIPHYDLVLYCPLRDEKIAEAKTLKDLFEYQRNNFPTIADLFYECNGKGMLIIFDGWDELASKVRLSSLATSILHRKQLHQCSVIVTSRTYASSSLIKPSLSRHVQVIGFSKDEIAKVIIQTLQKNKELAQDLIAEYNDHVRQNRWLNAYEKSVFFKSTDSNEESLLAVNLINDLKVRSDVQSLCFIPLICSIVISVYLEERKLKTTLTELYENFIIQTIGRQMRKNGDEPQVVDSLSSLLDELAEPFGQICHFAYTNLANTVMTFSSIHKMSAAKDNNYFGLLTTFKDYRQEKYQFLHLSIQEFLAAWWIAKQPNPEQIFHTHLENDHFRMCLRFVAGLTKLSPHENYEQYFNKSIDLQCKTKRLFGFDARYQSYFYTNPIVEHVHHDNFLTGVDSFPILLLHLLYESQNKELCQTLALSISPQSICLHALQFSLFDVLCLNYFLNVNSTTCWNHLHLMPLYQDELSVFTNMLNTKRLDAHFYRLINETILQLRNIQECYIEVSGTLLYTCDVLVQFLSFSQIKILHLKINKNTEKKYSIEHCHCSDLKKCLATKTTLQEFNVDRRETNQSNFNNQEMIDFYNHESSIFKTIIEGICKNTSITFLSMYFAVAYLSEELIKQLFNENKTLKAFSGTFLFSPEDMVETISTSLVAMDTNLPLGLINGLECILLQKLYPSHVINPSLVVTSLPLNTPESAAELFDILETDNKLKALRLKIFTSAEKFSCDIYPFKSMSTSMKEMLQQNQTLQCLEIETTFDIRVSNTRNLSHTFLSCLITGLEGNNTLQQLCLPIPLTTNCVYNKENDVKALFSLLSCREKLTELQLDFYGHDQEQTIVAIDSYSIFQDYVLPMIINMLQSNEWIKVLSLNVHFFGSPRRNSKSTWGKFFDAILNHPSLQHVGLKLNFQSKKLKKFLKGQIEVKKLKEAPVIITEVTELKEAPVIITEVQELKKAPVIICETSLI